MERKKRLKILFLTPWYPSVENLAEGIFVKRHAMAVSLFNEVTLIAFSEGPVSQQTLYAVSESIEDGIKTIIIKIKRSPIPNTNSFFHLCAIWKCFRKLIKDGYKPDIIHANIYWAGVYAAILSRRYNVPFVITEHWTGFCNQQLTAVQKVKAQFSMNRAKIILPVSQDLKKHIEQYRINNKFRVVPNVVDTEVFYPLASKIDRGKKHRKKKMLLLAMLNPRKGIPYLLEALYQIKDKRQDFVLDVVGEGPNRSEYDQIAKNLGLNYIVRFHGRQSEIVSFMRECDFFVLPSLYENFGVVYIEAMACGKPVIATNAGGPREIVNNDVGIQVPPKDVKAIRDAVEYMLDNYQNYSPKRIARYAKERFSYQAVGAMLGQIYKEVAEEEI